MFCISDSVYHFPVFSIQPPFLLFPCSCFLFSLFLPRCETMKKFCYFPPGGTNAKQMWKKLTIETPFATVINLESTPLNELLILTIWLIWIMLRHIYFISIVPQSRVSLAKSGCRSVVFTWLSFNSMKSNHICKFEGTVMQKLFWSLVRMW